MFTNNGAIEGFVYRATLIEMEGDGPRCLVRDWGGPGNDRTFTSLAAALDVLDTVAAMQK